MNFIAEAIYPGLKRLAETGYSGMMLVKWENGVLVRAMPQKHITIEQAIRNALLDKEAVPV